MVLPDSAVIAFRGRVTSGRGKAAPELAGLHDELQGLGTKPLFPGSMNLVLDRPLRLRARRAFSFDRGQRMLWAATLNHVDVWIYRWTSCPLHIVEIVSPIHLRKRFLLGDGDSVTLGVSAGHVEQVCSGDRLAWAAFWLGRRRWTYSLASYFARVEVLAQRLGAAQQKPAAGGGARLVARALRMLR